MYVRTAEAQQSAPHYPFNWFNQFTARLYNENLSIRWNSTLYNVTISTTQSIL